MYSRLQEVLDHILSITLFDSLVNTVEHVHFLGTTITQLKGFNVPKTAMVHFYTAIIESISSPPDTPMPLSRRSADCCRASFLSQEDHQLEPSISLGPVHVQEPGEGRKDCGQAFSPRTKPFEKPISGRTLRSIKS